MRIASVLNKIIQNSNFKKKVSLEKEDRFLRGTDLDYADLFTIDLRNEDVQEFDTRRDEILFLMSKIPPNDVLESLFRLRIRESDQLKTVLEVYDLQIHQKISKLDYQNLKRWSREAWIRNSDYETLTPDTGKSKKGQLSRIEGD